MKIIFMKGDQVQATLELEVKHTEIDQAANTQQINQLIGLLVPDGELYIEVDTGETLLMPEMDKFAIIQSRYGLDKTEEIIDHYKKMVNGVTMKEEIIKAIREDETVGKGSLSDVDEALTDEELWGALIEGKAPGSVEAALAHAHHLHELWNSVRDDVRGEIF